MGGGGCHFNILLYNAVLNVLELNYLKIIENVQFILFCIIKRKNKIIIKIFLEKKTEHIFKY